MRSDRCAGRANGADSGMVTAELAACLPVLVLLLGFALSVVSIEGTRLRAQDAAREAARAAARGDRAAALRLVRSGAPRASVSISMTSDEVTAVVQVHAQLLVSWLPAVTITERAVAAAEPTAPP